MENSPPLLSSPPPTRIFDRERLFDTTPFEFALCNFHHVHDFYLFYPLPTNNQKSLFTTTRSSYEIFRGTSVHYHFTFYHAIDADKLQLQLSYCCSLSLTTHMLSTPFPYTTSLILSFSSSFSSGLVPVSFVKILSTWALSCQRWSDKMSFQHYNECVCGKWVLW